MVLALAVINILRKSVFKRYDMSLSFKMQSSTPVCCL